ncbi:MAG: hypothetical protein AAFV19_19930 [Pseudomonadota bacterium]
MLEFFLSKLVYLTVLSGTMFVIPVEALAALPAVVQVASEYVTELSLLIAGIAILIAVDTMSWPFLTRKK